MLSIGGCGKSGCDTDDDGGGIVIDDWGRLGTAKGCVIWLVICICIFGADADCFALTPIRAMLNDKYEPTITIQSNGIFVCC
jgi:hypothetical protein